MGRHLTIRIDCERSADGWTKPELIQLSIRALTAIRALLYHAKVYAILLLAETHHSKVKVKFSCHLNVIFYIELCKGLTFLY